MAESASDIRARRPGAAPSSDGPRPLGVPEDYTVPGQVPSQTPVSDTGNILSTLNRTAQPIAPRYFDGDQWRPASLPPNRIAELQQDLVEAGALEGRFRIGVWDKASRDAYKAVLETANASGTTAPEALATWRAGTDTDTEPGAERAKRAPLVVRQSNPDDLRAVFRKSARSVLGRKLDDSQVDRMVAAYQAAEAAPQRQAHAMGGDEFGDNPTGGTVTDPMDPRTFGEIEAREADPLRADSRKVVKQFDALAGMLGEGGLLQTGGAG